MNTERLALMAKLLFEVSTKQWKGGPAVKLWNRRSQVEPQKGLKFDLLSWVERSGCGYSACAVGHACLDPRFNEQGLVMDLNYASPLYIDKSGYKRTSWMAVETFFGIGEKAAEYLFQKSKYKDRVRGKIRYIEATPEMVLGRIVLLMEIGEQKFNEAIFHKLDQL